METKYDAIVIGSGCGGAAAAALAGSLGLKTLLLEKNRFVGGRAATHEIDGFKMDHGHIIMRSERGAHGKVLKIAGCKDLIPEFTHCTGWTTKCIFDDVTLDFNPNFWHHFFTPGLLRQLSRFGMSLHEYLRFGLFGLRAMLITERGLRNIDHEPMPEYLHRYFSNRYLHLLFEGLAAVGFGALNNESSAGEMMRVIRPGIWDFFNMGYPVNGEGVSAIPKSFLKAAKRRGCHIRLNTPVRKIVVENNRALGVRINGETIHADHVISNIGVRETVIRLVGAAHFDPSYYHRIDNLKYSYGGISLKYAVDKPITPYAWGGEIPGNLDRISEDMSQGRTPEKFPFMFVAASNIDKTLAPPGRQVLSFISGGPAVERGQIDWTPWVDRFKNQVETFFPGLKENTLFCDISTPDDIAGYTGRFYGDAVGVAQTVDQVDSKRPSIQSPIQGLYYVGADVGRGSFATELASQSAIALHDLLKEKIAQKGFKGSRGRGFKGIE